MNQQDHISDESLKKDFPLLFGQDRTEAFHVPEGYFESLPSQVMDRIKREEEAKVIFIKRNRNWLLAAASVAAILLIGFFLFENSAAEQLQQDELLSLKNVEIPDDYILDFEEDLIIEVLYSDIHENEVEEDPYLQYLEEAFETEELLIEL